MKGLKKLALASAVLAVSTGAFAMEAMQDDALANTTGQDGLSILQANLGVVIQELRYTDNDGIAPAAATANLNIQDTTDTIPSGPCAGQSPNACATSFASLGTLQIADLQISASSILTTIDVGSTSTTSGGVTGLLIGQKISGLSISLGAISFDNGNELSATPVSPLAYTGANGSTAANKSATTNIGGIALDNLNLPAASAMLITAGATDLGSTSGLTITNLIPIASLGVDVNYWNTTMVNHTGSDTFTGVGAHANTDGVITLPIEAIGIIQGPIEIAAGLTSAGYGIAAGQGLEVELGDTFVSFLDIGNQNGAATATALGTTDLQSNGGIKITGTTVGSVGIIGLNVASSTLYISGH